MPELIPVQDSSYFSELVDLDEVTFSLTFRWNGREEAWYFDIDEQDRSGIVRGQKLLPFVNLTERWADARMPAGVLVVNAITPNDRPTRESLFEGSISLIYFTEDEVINGLTV